LEAHASELAEVREEYEEQVCVCCVLLFI